MTTSPPTKKSSFIQRGLTATVFVILMLLGVMSGPHWLSLTFGLVVVLCLWEFVGVVFEQEQWVHKIVGLLLGVLPYGLASAYHLGYVETCWLPMGFTALLLVFGLFIYELLATNDEPFRNIAFVVLGAAYIGVPFLLLQLMAFKDGTFDYAPILGLMLMTWANDTGAYVVGSQIGRTPLMPRRSPKKTWEGTIGGVVVALLAAWGLSILLPSVPLVDWLVLGAIVGVFGTMGDLVESMLKRSYDLKDSSSILPGHGGFLDRFDAFLFMLPFAAVYWFLG